MPRYEVNTPTFKSVFITSPQEVEGEITWQAKDQQTGVTTAGHPSESDAFNALRDYLIDKLS